MSPHYEKQRVSPNLGSTVFVSRDFNNNTHITDNNDISPVFRDSSNPSLLMRSKSKSPNQMAKAMKLGVKAGRYGYLAGSMKKKTYASSSSPVNQISKSKFL